MPLFSKKFHHDFYCFVFQDGCLSLEEFLTAMHLVVLKRNNIDLPETLPPVLRPAYLKQRLSKSSKLMVLKPQVNQRNLYTSKAKFKP